MTKTLLSLIILLFSFTCPAHSEKISFTVETRINNADPGQHFSIRADYDIPLLLPSTTLDGNVLTKTGKMELSDLTEHIAWQPLYATADRVAYQLWLLAFPLAAINWQTIAATVSEWLASLFPSSQPDQPEANFPHQLLFTEPRKITFHPESYPDQSESFSYLECVSLPLETSKDRHHQSRNHPYAREDTSRKPRLQCFGPHKQRGVINRKSQKNDPPDSHPATCRACKTKLATSEQTLCASCQEKHDADNQLAEHIQEIIKVINEGGTHPEEDQAEKWLNKFKEDRWSRGRSIKLEWQLANIQRGIEAVEKGELLPRQSGIPRLFNSVTALFNFRINEQYKPRADHLRGRWNIIDLDQILQRGEQGSIHAGEGRVVHLLNQIRTHNSPETAERLEARMQAILMTRASQQITATGYLEPETGRAINNWSQYLRINTPRRATQMALHISTQQAEFIIARIRPQNYRQEDRRRIIGYIAEIRKIEPEKADDIKARWNAAYEK